MGSNGSIPWVLVLDYGTYYAILPQNSLIGHLMCCPLTLRPSRVCRLIAVDGSRPEWALDDNQALVPPVLLFNLTAPGHTGLVQ